MANINDGRAVAGLCAVEQITKAQRVAIVPRGYSFAAAGMSTGLPAALAANSVLWMIRNAPAANARRVFIDRIRVQFTTLVAFTTPLTAARRLALCRSTAATANPTGGAAMVPIGKDINHVSQCTGAGDCRIATTAALTTTSITLDLTNPIAQQTLSHVGAAGAFLETLFNFNTADSGGPIILEPGACLALYNPAAMDAAGTFQLAVTCDWHEAALYNATTSE